MCPPFTMITTASFTTEGNSFTTNNTGVFGLSGFFCWFCLQSGRENFWARVRMNVSALHEAQKEQSLRLDFHIMSI